MHASVCHAVSSSFHTGPRFNALLCSVTSCFPIKLGRLPLYGTLLRVPLPLSPPLLQPPPPGSSRFFPLTIKDDFSTVPPASSFSFPQETDLLLSTSTFFPPRHLFQWRPFPKERRSRQDLTRLYVFIRGHPLVPSLMLPQIHLQRRESIFSRDCFEQDYTVSPYGRIPM